VKLFPWRKEKEFFSAEEQQRIIDAIKKAETHTSGEVRLFIESKCRYVDAIDRAQEIFSQLEMDKTLERNASLIYVAVKDKQAAVYGDKGIYEKLGKLYWEEEVNKMMVCFKQANLAEGIVQCISDIGDALHQHFPYDRDTDKNELPDEIIFGK